ncbi:carbonic anhydrase [Desulfovibrio sp. PG-178-WT-4]|uniref:carbonic anhydrase n=1 Tax=Desulfovibrio porci TaxID=2605782 RepID=A0A6L5XJM2_9BACT|nr:carbonic anhydrase [uncultured Desulfovibrio sp.]MSS27298.1 carbonic anhydrase [Desulfovibrio porci]
MHCLKDFIAGFRGFQDSYFTSEKSLYSSLREGQNPKALVVACSDSRADPALVLGCKPGDIFVVRNVANLVPHREDAAEADAVTAALAYGVMHLGIEHVIVLGHSGCGGIAALLAHEKEETRDLISPWISLAGRALGRIRPLLEAGPESSARRACEQVSLLVSLRNLLSYPWIAQKVGRQELALHAWYFDLEQGELLGYFPASGGFEPLIVRP